MKTLIVTVGTLILSVLLVPLSAYAFNLYTAPTQDIDAINCSIVNVSNITLQVEFEVYDYSGGVVSDPTTQLLDPGEVGTLTWGGGEPAYCKFKVKAKNKKKTARKKMVRALAAFVIDGAYAYSTPAR